MQLFSYLLRVPEKYQNPDEWGALVVETVQAHAAYLERALENGTALFVGRTDADMKDNYGLVVIKCGDIIDARVFMENDPVIKAGIMVASVLPFKLLKVTPEAADFNLWE